MNAIKPVEILEREERPFSCHAALIGQRWILLPLSIPSNPLSHPMVWCYGIFLPSSLFPCGFGFRYSCFLVISCGCVRINMHIQRSDGIGEVLMLGDHATRGFSKRQCIASSLDVTLLSFFLYVCRSARLESGPRRQSPYRADRTTSWYQRDHVSANLDSL